MTPNYRSLNYTVRYTDGSRHDFTITSPYLDLIQDPDGAAHCYAAERYNCGIEALDMRFEPTASASIWQCGSCFGFWDMEGFPSMPYRGYADAVESLHAYIAHTEGTDAAEEAAYWAQIRKRPTPWGKFALMVLISLAVAGMVIYLTDGWWWFPVGIAAYTVTSCIVYAILDLDGVRDELSRIENHTLPCDHKEH